jgi:subfamily B ATP-binding cassette protein MsbA
MKNLFRAVRLALRRKWTLAAAAFCSLMIALCWGANIGAIYPFIQIVFRGDSLHDWVDGKIAAAMKETRELDAELAALATERPGAGPQRRAEIDRERGFLENRRKAEQDSLGMTRRLKPHIERYLPDDPFQTLLLVAAFLFLGTLVKDVFLMLNTGCISRVVQWTTLQLRNQFIDHTIRMDVAALNENRTGGLVSRFNSDLSSISTGVGTFYGESFREPLKLLVCLSGAAMVSWRLLFFSMLITPLSFFLVNRLGRLIKHTVKRSLSESAVIVQRLCEVYGGIQAVKAFTMEAAERARLQELTRQMYRRSIKLSFYIALAKPINELFGIGVVCIALIGGGYLVLNQETHLLGIKMSARPLDFGAVTLFFGFLIGASDPARKLSFVINELHRAAAAADRLYPLLDEKPTIADPARPAKPPKRQAEVVFDRVSFHYRPDQPVLNEIELRIPFGQTVAIVGPNGCGKSTLINLLPRFYDSNSGEIRLDFTSIREMSLFDLRSRIGMVTQQTLLFDDSVRDNIRYGSPDASDEQVIAAAKQAHAHEFIVGCLEQGYDTIVGERGNCLSGGQRQRIALARAILRDPAILILDEATSQVDPESERLIHEALEQFVRGRTAIVVTHRASTLSLADRIVVMENGRIVDSGAHRELLGRCEFYRRFHGSELKQSA